MTNKKICIIAGCSQKKLNYAAPAHDLNQGQLFKSIKKLAIKNNFDLKILSGKYGLLDGIEIIGPYNQKIRTKKDISEIRSKVLPTLKYIWKKYDTIIVIMGKNYRIVLEPYLDKKFIIVFDKRGIGGYLSLLSRYNKLQTKKLMKELDVFRFLNNIPKMKYYYFGRNLKNLIFNIAFLIVLEDEESGIEYADNMEVRQTFDSRLEEAK